MKLRNALAAGVGAVGATALANRALTGLAGDLEPGLDGEHRTYRWRGMDIAYTEAGDTAAPDLVLLHGMNAAGTSREFAPIVADLAERYHVVAPDFPGFGCSDRPPIVYSASLYESFVTDFARDICENAENAACVASSLSGAYAASAAREGVFDRLVLICPTADTMPGGRRLWLRSLLRAPLVGTAAFNLLASKPSIRYNAADHGYYDPERKPEGLADYQWRSAHQPGARYAPASFISGFLDPEMDLGETLSDLDLPVTLVWGRETEITPLRDGRELADDADARLVVFDYAKLQPHAEHPDRFLEVLSENLPATAEVDPGSDADG